MDGAKSSDKAIVFYGSAHGAKRSEKYFSDGEFESLWKMTGVYLSDYYGEDYVSYHICYVDSANYKNMGNECVVLSGKNYERFVPEDCRGLYDYECVSRERVYGVIYPYVCSQENIEILLSKVTRLCDRLTENETGILDEDSWQKIDDLFAIYYLKYWLGDSFDFDYKNGKSLREALGKIDWSVIAKKLEQPSHPVDLQVLEKYSECLMSYNHLEDYLYSPDNDKRIDYILYNMNRAKKINPQDIWAQYWISYFETEKAMYSGKKKDYKNALREWEELLQNDLVYASPVVKLVYQKAMLCAEKSGERAKAETYREMEKNLNPIFDIDYEKYFYFGY